MFPLLLFGVVVWYLFSTELTYSPLKVDRPSFTMYYASWCGHCKKAAPEWKKLGSSYYGIEIRAVEEKKNNEFQVRGFPTIVYRDGNGSEEIYDGARTLTAWKAYLHKKNSE
jgi:thiol-disulfide isomerase/thioredoxin